MPPKKRKGRKGKGKRKGKKKGKKKKLAPEPPPLHLLTELYKKLDDATMELYEMRIATRRKRLETWYMMLQIAESKLNNQVFKEYIQGKMNDLQEAIDRFLKLIQDERDAINAAIKKICDEYERMKQEFLEKSAKLEEELANIRLLLQEFEPMMRELERLMARLEPLRKEIEAAQIDANQKIRHLTNQFLHERGRLHNHLEEQLCLLIRHCRSYIMPILWNFMQRLIARNICARWKLARVDETNIALAEKREELIRRRKSLTLEKPYWSIEWALYRMAEDAAAAKKAKIGGSHKDPKIVEVKELMVGKTDQEMAELAISGGASSLRSGASGGTILSRDFNRFLIQRLTAASAAQARHDKSHKKEKTRFMEAVLQSAAEERRMTMAAQHQPSQYFDDDDFDDAFGHDQWDDIEDHDEEEDDEEEEEYNTEEEEENEDEEEDEEEEEEEEEEDKSVKPLKSKKSVGISSKPSRKSIKGT